MVLLSCQSEGGMNNVVAEDAYVIKERVTCGGQVLPRDSQQSAWNFHLQTQEICAESHSSVEDTGVHIEQNSMELTAVVPVHTETGTEYSDNLYSPCTFMEFPLLAIFCSYFDVWHIYSPAKLIKIKKTHLQDQSRQS
jgi:hypothetical protein